MDATTLWVATGFAALVFILSIYHNVRNPFGFKGLFKIKWYWVLGYTAAAFGLTLLIGWLSEL